MKILLSGADHAPTLFRDEVISEPDLSIGGVYLFVIDRNFIKVGSSKKLQTGIYEEIKGFNKNIVNKHSKIEVFVVSNTEEPKAARLKLRKRWIDLLMKKAPTGKVLNRIDNPKLKFYFDPKANHWTQNMVPLATVQSPHNKIYRINAEGLTTLMPERTYFEVMDHMRSKGWYTMGLSFFVRGDLPKTQWSEFAADPDFKKTFKGKKAKKK